MPSGYTPLVLIADANAERRSNLSHLLRQDFQIIEARQSDECLAKYEQYRPRVILIDAGLPDVDGYRLCREIRRLSQSEPAFLMMMVPNETGAIELAFKSGATDCLIPPIHHDSLRYRLQQWLATQKLTFTNQPNHTTNASGYEFQYSLDGMYHISLDGRFLKVNPALVHMLGYESEDEVMTLRMPQDVFVEEPSPISLSQLAGPHDVIQGTDRVWQRRDGEHIIVSLRDRIVRDEVSGSVYIEGLVQDVTNRRRTEQMLESIVKGTATKIGDEFFRSVLQYLAVVSRVKYAYVGELVEGQIHVIALWAGTFIEREIVFSIAGTPAETVIAQGKADYPLRTHELFPQDKTLSKYSIEAYMGAALYGSDERPIGLIAIMNDGIIENPFDAEAILDIFAARVGAEIARKRTEKALRERELRFRAVIENASDFVLLTNAQGENTYVSPAFTSTLGFEAEELLGKARFDLIHPEDLSRIAEAFSELVKSKNGSRVSLQYRVHDKDGGWHWLEAKAINLLEEVGVNAVVSHFRDITESKQSEMALRESEERFRHISEISSDYTFALRVLPDMSFTLEWITDVFKQITGFASETTITYEDWLGVTHLEDVDELAQHLKTLVNVAITIETEYRIQTKERGIRHIVGQMRSIKDENHASVSRIYGTARDITEQKLAQDAEREQRQLAEALLHTASRLSSTLDLKTIMQHVLEQVGTVVPHDAANIMLVEAAGARVVHGRGYPEEFVPTLGDETLPLDTFSLATMIDTGEPYIVSDTRNDQKWVPSKSVWTRSYLGVPIQTTNKFIGFLNLNSRTPAFFTQDHAQRLKAFADQMAIAMENAWLFEQAQNEISERKAAQYAVQQREAILKAVSFAAEQLLKSPNWREVIQVILKHLGQAAGVSRAYVFEDFVDDGNIHLVRYSYEWVAEGIEAFIDDPQLQAYDMQADGLGRWLEMLKENSIVAGHIRRMPEGDHPIMTEQNIMSIALVPLFVKDAWWGFMGFDMCHVEREWMSVELDALQTAANILGGAIDRQNVEAEVKRRNQELEALRSIALAVGSTLKLDEVLSMLLTQLRELVPYQSASIALVDEGRLHFVAWRDFPENTDFEMLERTLRDKMMERLDEMGHGYLIMSETQGHSDWVHIPNILENICSWLGIALVHRGKILGVLNLDHSEANFYSETHAALAMAVAQQAANAIENARLYGELRHQVIERTTELTVQRGQTELILKSVADGIILMDTDGKIRYVNPAWERLTGFTADEVLGMDPYFWMHDVAKSWTFDEVRNQLMSGEIWRDVVPIVDKNGSAYEVETIVAPIVDDVGDIFQLVGVQRDVTEARRGEAMRTQFIADAAHDLGNPVATLQLRLFLLEADPDNFGEHLNVITHQVERLEALSTNLLMLSRLDRGILPSTYEQIDLNVLVGRIVAGQLPLANRKHLVLTFEPNATLSTILGSSDQLERVVVNLIGNAINYTPEHGKIMVRTDYDHEWVKLIVEDTGIGILPENIDRIFERFFRSDRVRVTTEGTGLGLSIVKEIVDLHRGKIDVESVPDKGTSFTILLPNRS